MNALGAIQAAGAAASTAPTAEAPGASPGTPPTQSPGSFGKTQRPKNRFIDRVLMHQRDQKQQDATNELMTEQGAVSGGAPNPLSATPGVPPGPGGSAPMPPGGMAQMLLKLLGKGQ